MNAKKTDEPVVKICEVDPSKIKIGAGAVEAVIKGEHLAADMKAAVCMAGGNSPVDPAILVEQPLPGDVTESRFPITITVPSGTPEGIRAVVMLKTSGEVARHETAITLTN